MKILILLLCVGFSSSLLAAPIVLHNGRVVHRVNGVSKTVGGTQSLEKYLVRAYNLENMKIEKDTTVVDDCGDAYYLEFSVPSFWDDVQVEMKFYVQTLTLAAQERIYNAIKANYASKGLPQCLLHDQFYLKDNGPITYNYNYSPSYTTVAVPVGLVPVPAGQLCAGKYLLPLTSCWNVEKLY